MPKAFCATHNKTLVKEYMVEQSDSQCKVLEDLFREIDEVKADKWTDLKAELDTQLRNALGKNPPNFTVAHMLTEGIRKVEELGSVDSLPSDLLHEMSEKLLARNRHRVYLEQVLKGLHTIKKAQLDHLSSVRNAETSLKQMVSFVVTPKLPEQMLKIAKDSGQSLRLERVRQRFEALKLNRREKLTDCTFAPTKACPLEKLKQDKIILDFRMSGEQVHKSINLVLTMAMDGGVDIEINMKKKDKNFLMRQLKVTMDQIQQFKKTQEGDTTNLPNEKDVVMVVDPARLSKLITDISNGV
jgi:hypothetical protein